MTNEIEQGLHEKLCAAILGEASEEVRAEVARALEQSPELRAERDRLEKTIGLVRVAMAGSESLAPSAVSEILANARAPRIPAWHVQRTFRIAAGIAAAAIVGVVGFRVLQVRRTIQGDQLAMVPSGDVKTPVERRMGLEAESKPAPAQEPALLANADKKADEAAANAPMDATNSVASAPATNLTVASLERLDAYDRDSDEAGKKIADLVAEQESNDRLRLLGYTRESGAGKSVLIPPVGASVTPSTEAGTAIGIGSGGNAVSFGGRKLGPGPSPVAGQAGSTPTGPGGASVPSIGDNFQLNKCQVGEPYYSWRDTSLVLNSEAKYGRAVDQTQDARRLELEERIRGFLQKSPEDRERWIDSECQRIITGCRRFPNERPRDMFFRFWGDNPFELAALDPLSTFSVDVDTASYTLARRYLNEGHIPEKAQVRTEEFVNYFKADVPAPTEGTFAIHTDLTPSRFSSDKARWMLRVVVRGREVTKQERKPLNLTFVIDVSGSMREQNRLEMVKHAVRLLVGELDARDNLAIVVFSNDARLVLPMTSAKSRGVIESALFPLQPENSTNSEAGLKMGYEVALASLSSIADNRVVFLSDGVANVGETDPAKLSDGVKAIREKGVYLNTIGVGMNNHNDVLLEQLADKGDGVCNYVDTPAEARRTIVDNFTGAFQTIARDVKVQVEFDPAQVDRYRLLGYEDRAIADKDFRNDKIDAGEIGAGHQVTALYEIERTATASEKSLATVRLRWKAPRNVNTPASNEEATEISKPVLASQQTSFEGAGPGYRRAAIVAQFAEFLRRSVHARGDPLDDLIAEAEKLEKETQDPELGELVVLMHKSKQLILQSLPDCDELCQAIDAVRRNQILRCERELVVKELDAKWVQDLESDNARLEKQIKDLLRRKLEQNAR